MRQKYKVFKEPPIPHLWYNRDLNMVFYSTFVAMTFEFPENSAYDSTNLHGKHKTKKINFCGSGREELSITFHSCNQSFSDVGISAWFIGCTE